MNKYEISLWEDFPRTIIVNGEEKSYLDEKKLCVIGSSSMTSMVRAVEPKLVNNVNGTNTFTFKMYYTYIDEITGESYPNPFISMLINERKVKVFWKDEWYDLLIKNIEENTNDKSVTYTCKDSYITELSRNGYNLEFTSELQNNNGTARELTNRVLEGSGWKFDEDGSTNIYQTSEEPVYEVSFPNSIQATLDTPSNHTSRITIPAGRKVLVYKTSLDPAVANGGSEISNADIQILYADGGYATEENEMVVLNGEQYKIQGDIQYRNPYIELTVGSSVVQIKYSELSTNYRGKRYVNSPRLEYDEVFGRYVNVYNYDNREVYGFSKTEFSDPLTIINLFANSSRFSNTSGWIGKDLSWGVYPKYDGTQELDTYRAKGYLRLKEKVDYTNSGIQANSSYLMPSQGDLKRGITGGFHKGEIYIFRIKALQNLVEDQKDTPWLKGPYISDSSTFIFNVKNNGTDCFSVPARGGVKVGDWLEYTCTCIRACPATEIENLELSLYSTDTCWIEDVQFFKLAQGITAYQDGRTGRINPGEISLQGIATTVYRFYDKNHGKATSPKEVPFIYIGDNPSGFSLATSYEKIATIEEKESNRFNILQAIAESFECWVRFKINHDDQGKVIIGSDGEPEKYVTLVDQVGEDLGWSFDYGIDLKAIKRKIISDEISTKVIVVPNQNEFAKNGFCTIARSSLNYSKEIFILNFDYYINQGLLNRDQLYLDLYGTSNDDLGYFYHLSQWNAEYDDNAEKLAQKKSELLKQEAELLVSQSHFQAAKERITSEQSDVMFLAGVNSFSEVEDYVDSHQDNKKVLNLMNDIGRLRDTVDMLDDKTGKIGKLNSSIDILKKYIYGDPDDPNKPGLQARQNELQTLISNIHKRFFKKYARYIQEGTWIDEDYVDDDKYYLDALEVAYTSSRPQIQYDINVIRLNYLEDFSSKIFHVGDICYIKDQDFFNYITTDGLPYRLKILISEITTYFDSPEKDTIKVQNYKTQFDDLFERIAAATQSLQFSTGKYSKAAGLVNPDKTINFGLLQETFDYNKSIVLNAANQTVVWDSTGITVTDSTNAAQMLRLMSGGLFITNDGGLTWKNAVRGDGISADILTAGRINVGEIYLYNEEFPSFRWDSDGLTAYSFGTDGKVNFNKFVRHDQYGFYGYNGKSGDFIPQNIDEIKTQATFGLTWDGFFMNASDDKGSSVIINSNDTKGNIIKCTQGTDTNITFALNKDGSATFKGNITGGTIKIGGTEINPNFYVDQSGNVQLNGRITWGTNASPVKVLYIRKFNNVEKPKYSYNNYQPSNPNDWHQTLDLTNDYYMSYSYDGGKTWTDPLIIQGEKGDPGTPGGSTDMTAAQIIRKIQSNLVDGIYPYDTDTDNPKIGINATYIQTIELDASKITTGTLDANKIILGNSYGGICVGKGNNGSIDTYGPMLYGGSTIPQINNGVVRDMPNNYIIATASGARMTSGNMDIYVIDSEAVMRAKKSPFNTFITVKGTGYINLIGRNDGSNIDTYIQVDASDAASGYKIKLISKTVVLKDDIAVTSDRNKKNSIAYDLNKYEKMFHLLKPAYYKMNDGTSERFHVGFIYQDVEDALINSGLTTKDFAALVKLTERKNSLNENNDNEENNSSEEDMITSYTLRYAEFISLNTYMIQKAYARIEALESELKILKSNKNEE